MARPIGSKNKPKDDNGEALRNSVDGIDLGDYIARIEDLNAQQKEISSDRQAVFRELKQAGYDRDTVREIVRKRKLTVEQRHAAAALLDQYLSALGDYSDTPLGLASVARISAPPDV